VRLAIILVALGLADGDDSGQVEAAKELLQVERVLAGGIDANVELNAGILLT
jgi:hypothetical protein